MTSPKINYWLDLGMGISFVSLAITGILKFPGLIRNVNLPWHTLSEVHDWSGIVLCAFVLIHLMVHWKWIVAMTKCFFRKESQ